MCKCFYVQQNEILRRCGETHLPPGPSRPRSVTFHPTTGWLGGSHSSRLIMASGGGRRGRPPDPPPPPPPPPPPRLELPPRPEEEEDDDEEEEEGRWFRLSQLGKGERRIRQRKKLRRGNPIRKVVNKIMGSFFCLSNPTKYVRSTGGHRKKKCTQKDIP